MNHFLGEYTEPIVIPENTNAFIVPLVPICSNCRFWEKWASGEYGKCLKITVDSTDETARIWGSGELVTKPNHHCGIHQFKVEMDK